MFQSLTKCANGISKGKSLLKKLRPNLTTPSRSYHYNSKLLSSSFYTGSDAVHRDTPYNNENTPWDFTKENHEKVAALLAKYPSTRKQSAIIPLLHLAQEQHNGWIPLNAMRKIAEICGVHPRKVFECATFYTMFNREPVGKFHVYVCVTTPCMLCGSDNLLTALEDHLGIHLGETTADGLFTLGEMECMGCCVNAPMIVVADYSKAPHSFSYNYYEDLTVERTIEIVEMLRRGEQPPVGPQTDRRHSMGIQGRTTLFDTKREPYCRELPKKE